MNNIAKKAMSAYETQVEFFKEFNDLADIIKESDFNDTSTLLQLEIFVEIHELEAFPTE